jgi:hypothetical protein
MTMTRARRSRRKNVATWVIPVATIGGLMAVGGIAYGVARWRGRMLPKNGTKTLTPKKPPRVPEVPPPIEPTQEQHVIEIADDLSMASRGEAPTFDTTPIENGTSIEVEPGDWVSFFLSEDLVVAGDWSVSQIESPCDFIVFQQSITAGTVRYQFHVNPDAPAGATCNVGIQFDSPTESLARGVAMIVR